MSKIQQACGLTVLAAALAAATGAALAQDAPVTELTKPSSSISLGAGAWSKDRPQGGIYDGMNEKGGYGLLDASVIRRDDATGTWFSLRAQNLGLETRELRADWLRQGNIGAFLEYSRTPRDNPYTFMTGVQGIGSTTLRTPATANPTLSEVHLGTVRDLFHAGVYKNLFSGVDFRVNFRNEDKSGTRQWGRGGAAEFSVEPISSTTQQLEAVLDYLGKQLQVSGGYYGSWYKNTNQLVDTAYTPFAAATQYFLSLPLDNQAHQLFVNGGYNFTPSTRGAFKASYTHATQNERIPTADVAAIPKFAGAPTNLDGKLDNTLLQVGVTSRATSDFSWLANLRYFESKENTPQVRVIETNPACLTSTQCVDNTPLTFKTLTGKLEGTYRLPQQISLIGGIEQANQDRNVPVGTVSGTGVDLQRWVPLRAKLDETTYRVQLRRSLADTVNGSLAYLHSDRTGSEYTRTNEAESDEINPIHIADRRRDKLRYVLDWAPIEPLSFTLNLETAKDKYGSSAARPYGLQDGTASVYSIDGTYSVTERWQVSAWYTRDRTEANQFGQRAATGGAGAAEKAAHLEDTGNTFGAGLRGVIIPKLKVGADVLYSKNVNKYPETVTLAGAGAQFPSAGGQTVVGPLPDITNQLTRLKLFAVYALEKNADLRFDYIYEYWKTDDWSWLFANGTTFTYGITTDGTQVTQSPKQTANYVGVRYTVRFQ